MLVIESSHTLFQALADPTRIRVVRLLYTTSEEVCLCEFVDSLLEPEYKISRHLKTLKQAGLLSSTKDGRWIYYRLVNEAEYLKYLYMTVFALLDEDKLFANDLARFRKRMSLRKKGKCRIGIQTPSLKTGKNKPII